MTSYPQTQQNRVARVPKRGHYDHETVHTVIDSALICHVGFVDVNHGQPFVIPTLHARHENMLLLHGASTSRLMKHAAAGNDLCITVTLVDGLVLARSVFNHSVNYRSAVVFGQGQLVASVEEKLRYLALFTEKLTPGRWEDARQPTETELKATAVIAMPIDSASAKIREGGPKDIAEDYALPVWAGVLPFQTQLLAPVPDPEMPDEIPLPDYVRAYYEES